MKNYKAVVLGDGGWGTTLAILLSRKGYNTTLWGAFEDYTGYLERKRVNSRFLPGISIPKEIVITHDLAGALEGKNLVVIAAPSEYMRPTLRKIRKLAFPRGAVYVSVAKGIETSSLKRMSELIRDELGAVKIAVLSGPTIAHEVALGIPTTAVAASSDKKISREVQGVFMSESFRIYTNNDVAGVELGGSLKNVIAIACGISDGLGFGTNTKAAILSRGLSEISRLGRAMGARAGTFSGLSGLGDLVTTCISSYSRNRFIGEQIGKGKGLKKIRSGMQMVAEGVPTTASAYKLSRKHRVEMPITEQVYYVLYRHKSPRQAVRDLMTRKKKEE